MGQMITTPSGEQQFIIGRIPSESQGGRIIKNQVPTPQQAPQAPLISQAPQQRYSGEDALLISFFQSLENYNRQLQTNPNFSGLSQVNRTTPFGLTRQLISPPKEVK